jgi:hypothetical protein
VKRGCTADIRALACSHEPLIRCFTPLERASAITVFAGNAL